MPKTCKERLSIEQLCTINDVHTIKQSVHNCDDHRVLKK